MGRIFILTGRRGWHGNGRVINIYLNDNLKSKRYAKHSKKKRR